jgi:hypothetical protein
MRGGGRVQKKGACPLGLNSETPHSFGMSALGAYFWNALIIKGRVLI